MEARRAIAPGPMEARRAIVPGPMEARRCNTSGATDPPASSERLDPLTNARPRPPGPGTAGDAEKDRRWASALPRASAGRMMVLLFQAGRAGGGGFVAVRGAAPRVEGSAEGRGAVLVESPIDTDVM